MENKFKIIYNLLFKKTKYVKAYLTVEPRNLILKDKNITIFRGKLDISRHEMRASNRSRESYFQEVRLGICESPEFMNAIEVEAREIIEQNIVRFEAELKVII
jgi:hypothetical protein